MKVAFDLDEKLMVIEADALIGQEGRLTIVGRHATYCIEGLEEKLAKRLVMEAYNSKTMNLTGYATKIAEA